MPLHTDDRLELAALHGLDDTIRRLCHHAELVASLLHGLMVEGVHVDLLFSIQFIEDGVFHKFHAVRLLRTVSLLRVFDICLDTDVLSHLAAKGNSQCLDTTADAQDRYLTVVGQTGDHQFGQVALLVDATQTGRRLITAEEGVDVTATAEDQCIDTVKGVDQRVGILHRRDNHRHTTSSHHRLVVALTQFTGDILKIARDTNDRLILCLRKTRIDLVEIRLQFKLTHILFI